MNETAETRYRRARDIDNGLRHFCELAGRAKPGGYVRDSHMSRIDCRPTAWLGFLFGAGLPPGEEDGHIREAKARMARGEWPGEWLVGPFDAPQDLGPRLEAAGFRLLYGMSGMAVEMAMDLAKPCGVPDGYRLVRISSRQEMAQWCGIVSTALFGGAAVEPEVYGALAAHADTTFYAAYIGDLMVGTSMGLRCDGVVDINMVSTQPEHRRRGLGAALTAAVMSDAAKAGCGAAVLQASSMGESVYRAMGFVEYCRYAMYGIS